MLWISSTGWTKIHSSAIKIGVGYNLIFLCNCFVIAFVIFKTQCICYVSLKINRKPFNLTVRGGVEEGMQFFFFPKYIHKRSLFGKVGYKVDVRQLICWAKYVDDFGLWSDIVTGLFISDVETSCYVARLGQLLTENMLLSEHRNFQECRTLPTGSKIQVELILQQHRCQNLDSPELLYNPLYRTKTNCFRCSFLDIEHSDMNVLIVLQDVISLYMI